MDQELRIKVAAETGAAQDALGRLSDEMTGLAKASGGAGTEQQKLARQVAETTARVAAAREAVQRVKAAETEAAAVTRAFGKESREAAEAQQRLRTAEVAATQATREAERALAGASTAVSAAAKNVDERGVAALRRMNDQLQRVGREADRAAAELRTLDARMQTTGRATQTFNVATRDGGESVSQLGSLVGKVGPMLGGAAFAGGALAAASAVREMSGEVMSFETALANLPFGLEAARKATKGLVNDQQLAQSAAQGLALGVVKTEDEFARLAEAATKLGIKLGIGPSQALDNMMTALGRGSTEILDNLGVILKASDANDRYAKSIGKTADELTDAEKKVAFKTEAIRALTEAADQTTIRVDSAAAAVQRFGVRSDNAASSAKGMAVEVAGGFLLIAEALEQATPGTEKFNNRLAEQIETGRAYVDEMRKLEAATRAQAAAQAEYVRSLNLGLREMTEAERAAHDALGKAAFDRANTLGTLDGELLQHWETVKGFTASLWNQADAYAEATRKAREHAEAQKVAEDALWKKLEERNRKAEEKAIEDAFFASNEMGPALPPGFKRHEKKGKKQKDLRMARHEFGTEVADFEFETTKAVREQDLEAQVKAFEAEDALRERRLAGIGRELELLEAKGVAEAEQVDMVFYTIEIESQAARQREALIDRRLAEEERLARWEINNAKTKEQLEKGQTRLAEVEHQKRVASLRKSAAEEERVHRQREKAVSVVVGAVTTLGEGMIGAFERMAAGEKGAMAEMLADLLKGVAKKHAILALGEAAQGVAATAATFGIVNPKAAAHFAAAALHTGVAVAAGVGAYAAGQVASARQGGGGGGGPSPFGSSGSSAGGGTSGAAGGRSDGGLEAQDVPVSHEQMRRGDASMRGGSGGHTVILQGGTFVGVGGVKQVVDIIEKELDRRARRGARPKN